MKAIGYCRVSTREQGLSRNGLDGQRMDMELFAVSNDIELLDIVYEVASAKLDHTDRPVLASVLQRAKQLKCAVIVSKLDRFSRSVRYISTMMEVLKADRIGFIVASMGLDVDPLVMHMFASIAENERRMIGVRTKVALAAVKAKGKQLGASGDRLSAVQANGHASQRQQAIAFAEKIRIPIQKMRARGMTQAQIADELNEYNTPTSRGGKWSATQVSRTERLLKMAL